MEEHFDQPSSYLNRFAGKQHKLAQLICESRINAGLVHTPGEIAQQPFLWNITASRMSRLSAKLKSFLEKTGLYGHSNRPHIICTGAGTSDFVGQSLVDLYRACFRTQTANWSTPRITANPENYFDSDQKYLLIHFARSGDSPESKAVLNLALKKYPDNIYNIVITCNSAGELARTSRDYPGHVFLITLHEDCNDKGLAMTGSFSSMVVAGISLVHLNDMNNYRQIVGNMADAAENYIDLYTDEIYHLADPVINRAFFLGNKDLIGAAFESALKVQELTAGQLIAKGDDTLSFRHGPVSAVDKNSLVCFFLSEDPVTRRYEIDVIHQYDKAFLKLGAKTIVICSNCRQLTQNSHITLFSYDPESRWSIPAYYQVNLAVLFGQLFGMFQAYRRNINVDDPSTGKALYSRIVHGVQIYEQ